MIKNKLKSVFILLGLTIIASGCSKEKSLLIKTSEQDRENPTVSLVRKVDLFYKDASGKEKFKQSMAVLGLATPVTLQSKNIEGFEIEEGGAFYAEAKSAEDVILLQGFKQVQEDGENIEILLSRNNQNTVHNKSTGSAWINSVRFSIKPGTEQDFDFKDSLFRTKTEDSCLEIPKISISPEGGWFNPYIRLIPLMGFVAPDISVVFKDANGNELGKIAKLPFTAMGDPQLVLNKDLMEGYFYKGSQVTEIFFYSKEYEGCLRLNTEFEAQPLKLTLFPNGNYPLNTSIAKENLRFWNQNETIVYPSENLVIENTNSFEVQVSLSLLSKNNENIGNDQICISQDSGVPFNQIQCYGSYFTSFTLKPYEKRTICIVGNRSILPREDEKEIRANSYQSHPLKMSFLDYGLFGNYSLRDKENRVVSEKSFKLK